MQRPLGKCSSPKKKWERNERAFYPPASKRGILVNATLKFITDSSRSHSDVGVCILGWSRLQIANTRAYATNSPMTAKLRIVENKSGTFAAVREAAENAARNLGFTLDLPQLSPELWQKVLVVTEMQMRMRSIELSDGWREKLAGQIWRPPGADGTQSAAWLTGCKGQQARPTSVVEFAASAMK